MSDDPRVGCSRRARPVAEAPVDALLARTEELAKRWAIALILARPLARIGEIPLEHLAREAPALCAQAVRALESEVELERMAAGGTPDGRGDSAPACRLGALAGARDAGSAVEAVEALRGVLWEALMDELREPPARQVAALADRLACVCATALAATITTAVADDPDVVARDAEVAAVSGSAIDDPHRAPGRAGAVLVDERADVPARTRAVVMPKPPRTSEAQPARAHPLPWDTPPPSSSAMSGTRTRPLPWYVAPRPAEQSAAHEESTAQEGSAAHEESTAQEGSAAREASAAQEASASQPKPPQPATRDAAAEDARRAPQATSRPEIEIRDERGEEGPAAWIGSIGRRLERFEQDGLPFAVLLVELVDLERIRHVELSEELVSLIDHVEGALAEELRPIGDRPAGSLTRERPGRYWLLVPDTDGIGAVRLAQRLVRAVSSLAIRRGLSLEVAVGTAACPEDGREAAALAAHADTRLYAKRATGRPPIGRPILPTDE